MAPPDLLLAFLVTTAIFAWMPGPAMLYAAARTIAGGRRAGLMATLGIHAGGWVHVIAATAGLSVLFHAVPTLYLVVKIAGAAYLVWLGIGMILARDPASPATAPVQSARAALRQSVLVEVLNPKTALFFLAFLPQFVDPSAAFPVWMQFLILGTVVNLMFSLADLVAVFFAAALSARLRGSAGAQRLLRRAGGAVLVGLGVNLAVHRA